MDKNKMFFYDGYMFEGITDSHIEVIKDWRNEDSTRAQFIYNKLLTSEDQQNWFMKYSAMDDDIMFMISDNETGAMIGVAALYKIDNDSAEFGRLMIGNQSYKGKGLGKTIVNALVNYAFEELNLDRVYLEVFKDNHAALMSYQKSGFKIFGDEKEANGRSLVSMEIIK